MRDLDFLPSFRLGEEGRSAEVYASAHFEDPSLLTLLPEAERGAEDEDVEGWTEIEPGRFMPRRTRGSCKGRALG